MSSVNTLLDLFADEEDEEDGDFVYGEAADNDASDDQQAEESSSDSDGNDNNVKKIEQTRYEFNVNVDPTVKHDFDVILSDPFSTTQHTFYLGFYPRNDETYFPFIFSHDIEKSIDVHFIIKINDDIQCNLEDDVRMTKEFPMVSHQEPIKDWDIPTSPFTVGISLEYIPNPNEARKYFNCIGLRNDGMTCYLNSLMQSLFHIRAFRKLVFDMNTKESEIPMALASLFSQMQTSSKCVSTRRLTRSFGWRSQDLFEQHDVQELMRILLDRLDLVSNNEASKLFKGVFNSYIRVPTKNYESSYKESFYDISLTVRGLATLQDSIAQFFEPDQMTGSDQYEMEDKTKVDALKGFELCETPTILCLHLRRFEFLDGQMFKISSRFEFPFELSFGDSEYRICSIIAHAGSFFGGHYNAFVLVDGRWLQFDDEFVREISEKDAIEGNFGGDRSAFTAYVLFYCKKERLADVIDCADPEINQSVLEYNDMHRRNREVRYITAEQLKREDLGWEQAKKTSIPKEGTLDDVKAVFAKETGIDSDRIVLRSVSTRKRAIENIVDAETVQTENFFFVSDTTDFPVYIRFFAPGFEFGEMPLEFVHDGTLFSELIAGFAEKLELSDREYPFSVYSVSENDECIEYFAEDEIKKSEKIVLQLQPPAPEATEEQRKRHERLSSEIIEKLKMKEFQPMENTPLSLFDDIRFDTVKDFVSLTSSPTEIKFVQLVDSKNPVTLVLPKDTPFALVVRCVAKKLDVEENRVLLFRNSIRRLAKFTFPTFQRMIEEYDEDVLYYDICPGDVSQYERADLTVVDIDGSQLDRFSLFLPVGQQTYESLMAAVRERIEGQFKLFYSKSGVPYEIAFDSPEQRAEFNHRYIAQMNIGELCEDEVELRVVYAYQYNDVNDSMEYVPFYLHVKSDKSVADIESELEQKKSKKVKVLEGSIRKLTTVDTKDMTAKDIETKFVALVTPFNYENMFGSSAPLHMNK